MLYHVHDADIPHPVINSYLIATRNSPIIFQICLEGRTFYTLTYISFHFRIKCDSSWILTKVIPLLSVAVGITLKQMRFSHQMDKQKAYMDQYNLPSTTCIIDGVPRNIRCCLHIYKIR